MKQQWHKKDFQKLKGREVANASKFVQLSLWDYYVPTDYDYHHY